MKEFIEIGKYKNHRFAIIKIGYDIPSINSHLNGYVEILPSDKRYYKKSYLTKLCNQHNNEYCNHTPEAELKVHGGITFSGNFKKDKSVPSSLQNNFWYGFDTAHASDDPNFGGHRKNKEYVENECKFLIDNIIEKCKTEKYGSVIKKYKGLKPLSAVIADYEKENKRMRS